MKNALHTYRWKMLRLWILRRDGYRCQSCGRPGRLEVDHIKPVNLRGDVWNPENLQTLCRTCHIRKTSDEATERNKPPPEVAAWQLLTEGLRKDG